MDDIRRVLVVEDDDMSRDFVVRMLESDRITAEGVADGPSCLERLEREPTPDLILLDISMPGMSGLEVLAWIRARWEAERLPVMMVSALAEATDVVRGLEAGANDYVTKPVNPPLLMARVRNGLRMRQGVASLVEGERSSRFLEALHRAVVRLERPIEAIVASADALREPDADQAAVADRLAKDSAEASAVVARFRALADLRDSPMHEGLSGLLDATLDRLADEDAG
ncbi:MAG: response regulator transcription factor [Phycisphaerales bacterium]